MPYDPTTPVGQVRLLINDIDYNDLVFTDADVTAFLAVENGVVKLAAAQALDVIADDEALTAKVITTPDVSTNGPAVAASLRARAAALRAQDVLDRTRSDAEGYFEFIPPDETPSLWEYDGYTW